MHTPSYNGRDDMYYEIDDGGRWGGREPVLGSEEHAFDNYDAGQAGQQHNCRLITRPEPWQPSLQSEVAECDIPYPSIETRDTLTPITERPHVFFILHEQGRSASETAGSFASPSPSPPKESYGPSPMIKPWSGGSNLKAYYDDSYPQACGQLHESLRPYPAKYTETSQYEQEPNMSRRFDLFRDREEDSPSPLPLIALPAERDFRRPHQTAPCRRPQHSPDNALSRWQPPREQEQWRHERDMSLPVNLSTENPAGLPNQLDPSVGWSLAKTLSCGVQNSHSDDCNEKLMTDAEAAMGVAKHLASFKRRCPASRHERILLGLIHPKTANAEFELDESALESIFSAANEIFFNGRLTQRVQWDWSDTSSSSQYDSKIIGHTSLRRARNGGFETFILLSTPILKNRNYNRRLLISAFLHELIHCYLFICCGWSARESGGHTDGFRHIADTIDRWAGRNNLYLCHVEADLERFRQVSQTADGGNASSESYGGYRLTSPAFCDSDVCCPTKVDAVWERCIHDRWDHQRE